MKLYHYSTTYNGSKSLTNDYNNRYKDAEPFILALERSKDVFYSTYYSALYLERQITELKLRSYEVTSKNACEAIFEYVRKTNYPQEISRLNCIYYCKDKQTAITLLMDDWVNCGDMTKEEVKLLEVEVPNSSAKEYDQEYYNMAYELVCENKLDLVFELASKYFSRSHTNNPKLEIMADKENVVIKEIEY